jgi:ABC-type glycerol-3-phosphate transport system substrate-binding protein
MMRVGLRALMAVVLGVLAMAGVSGARAASGDTVLTPADTGKLLPASVFFRGQSATTQIRNSGGVKFADGMMVLAVMVDTSGYSSDVQQKYQAYFIAETPIKVEGKSLPAGVYGVGFVAGGKFLVMDVGAHDVASVDAHADAEMKRPMPLKVVEDGDHFRLYAGRNYVNFGR